MLTIAWIIRALSIVIVALPFATGAEQVDVLPIRPLSFDAIIRDQTFAPNERAIELQTGFTALWYRDLEVRAVYRFLDLHSETEDVTQHIVFLNPRWNNFIDVLDFPSRHPINQIIRHVLFGPLQHRVVPYLGGVGGMVLPGPQNDHPGRFYGGQVGARFLLTAGVSLDVSLEYSRFATQVEDRSDEAQRWLMTIGIRF
jgi:hypothetical protein